MQKVTDELRSDIQFSHNIHSLHDCSFSSMKDPKYPERAYYVNDQNQFSLPINFLREFVVKKF